MIKIHRILDQRGFCIQVIGLLILGFYSTNVFAKPVSINCTPSNPGAFYTAFNDGTIQNGDTVTISGVCMTDQSLEINAKNLIFNGVKSSEAPYPTLMSTNNDVTFITVDSNASLVLNNLTIKGGDPAIINFGSLIISNSLVQNYYGLIQMNNSGTVPKATIINSTFSNSGVAILLSDGTLNFNNNTIAGGGIGITVANQSYFRSFSRNVFSNFDSGYAIEYLSDQPFNSNGYNILAADIFTAGSSINLASTDYINAPNNLLKPLADNGGRTLTFALQDSTLIGTPYLPPSTACTASGNKKDQRGAPRPGFDANGNARSYCSPGAYETGYPKLVITSPGNSSFDDPTFDFGTTSLWVAYQISASNQGNSPIIKMSPSISKYTGPDQYVSAPYLFRIYPRMNFTKITPNQPLLFGNSISFNLVFFCNHRSGYFGADFTVVPFSSQGRTTNFFKYLAAGCSSVKMRGDSPIKDKRTLQKINVLDSINSDKINELKTHGSLK